MTLRHLTVFTTVVEQGCSVTRAAAVLHIAQPAVSQTLTDLESHYGVPLFERLKRKLYLTPAGEKLLSYAWHICDGFATMEGAMLENAWRIPLRIGATSAVGAVLLPDLLARRKREQPMACPVHVSVLSARDIVSGLLTNQLDIGLTEDGVRSTELTTSVLAEDELVCVGRSGTVIDRHTIWILRGRDPNERTDVEARFKIPNDAEVWDVSDAQAVIRMASAGLGVAIVSRCLIETELENGSLTILPRTSRPVMRHFLTVHHKDKHIDTRLRAFLDFLAGGNV